MNQPIRGVSAKSGALWLSVIASLLLGASAFTLLRVRGVIEDFAESRIKGEVEQVVEKFAIIENKIIDLFNKGDHTRSFTYIDDITEPIHRLIKINYDKKNEISNNEILNIGGSKPVKLLRFIDIIEKYLGKKAKINLKPMQQGDVKETNANIDKLEKITGYRPQTNIEEGIKRFIDWYIQYHQ